jgi:hypothetical protein
VGKHRVVKAIKIGKLNEVKQILEQEPDLVNRDLKWNWGIFSMSARIILHIAAYNEQSEIVKFLIAEKGMDPNKIGCGGITPLHDAVTGNGWKTLKAARVLLEQGADQNSKDNKGRTSYNYCALDSRSLFHSICQEQLNKKDLAEQEKEKQQAQEATAKEDAARINGIWTKSSFPNEVIYERDLPQQQLRLREIFNFDAKSWKSITKDLQDGQMSQETKSFDEIADKASLQEAEAQLAKFGARIIPAETASVRREPENYGLLKKGVLR